MFYDSLKRTIDILGSAIALIIFSPIILLATPMFNWRYFFPAAPIVIELFQSQGCSSCPPANAALNAIAGRRDVIALSYAVTYWDRLGWKDKFADPAFTQRQYDYKSALKADSVYTPQVVLNGTKAIVGNGDGELSRAVKVTKPVSAVPAISLNDLTAG